MPPRIVCAVRGGAFFILLACGSGACTREREPDPERTVMQPDSLRFTVRVPGQVHAGAAVPLVFEVTNVSGRAFDLYLTGRDVTIDVTVRSESGEVVWRSLAGQAVPSMLQLRTLQPDETLAVRESWRPHSGLEPGVYSLEAALLGEAESRLRFATSRVELIR